MATLPKWFSDADKIEHWRHLARDKGVALDALPAHIAVIMDGNGRWAKRHGVSRQMGHKEGVEAVRRAVRVSIALGIEALTVYSFSSENWRRPADEVAGLLTLLRMFIRSDLKDLKRQNVHIRIIGAREGLAPDILALLEEAERETAVNTGLDLQIAFNYGGRDEIVRMVRKLAGEAAQGALRPGDIDEALISASLDTGACPDPDLLIRTSGEQRISNFLIWQCAYAEFVFQDVLWPDFSGDHLIDAIAAYQKRERRFGARAEAGAYAPGPDGEGTGGTLSGLGAKLAAKH